jgi:hypothetical protein
MWCPEHNIPWRAPPLLFPKRAETEVGGNMGTALLIGITRAMGAVALSLGVIVLGRPPPARLAAKQVQVNLFKGVRSREGKNALHQ